jgi:hypothetical protein
MDGTPIEYVSIRKGDENMTTKYEPPRVTFVGSDPKIGALKKAITRAARVMGKHPVSQFLIGDPDSRFIGLWQARNRRIRVLMTKVRDANEKLSNTI